MSREPPALPTPRCIRCAYALNDLPSPGKCPECAREFDLAYPSTYTTKPPFIGWVFWMPAWILAVAGGAAATVITAVIMGNWGWATWVGIPLSMGGVLGYATRVRWIGITVLCIAAALSLIFTLMSLNLAGVFCGLSLTAILAGPFAGGAFLGFLTRAVLKRTSFSQRAHLKALPLLLLGPLWALAEGRPGGYAVETVRTQDVIAAPLNVAWESLVFYEDVTHEPPLILRIGLAHPLYTTGAAAAAGDRRTCVYNKGRITKEVTRAEPGRLLAFDVIEQSIGYERDVRLLGGAFEFEPTPEGSAVTLSTTYEPYLAPRFAWRPFERLAARTLHAHVLEGMKRSAEGGAP